MDNLLWVQELIEAPDLEALGTVFEARLRAYVERGAPADERLLVERCAFEHEVRRYRTRAQERGYAYQQRFPRMPSLWVEFVNQNKAAENGIARLNVRRAYEAGRREVTEAAKEGWASEPNAASPVRSEMFDPIAMIDRLVQDTVTAARGPACAGQRLLGLPDLHSDRHAARRSRPAQMRRHLHGRRVLLFRLEAVRCAGRTRGASGSAQPENQCRGARDPDSSFVDRIGSARADAGFDRQGRGASIP